MGKHELWELQELQALPLDIKIKKTKLRIREWVEAFGIDGVVISFSGGKDSTVLLDIARKMYPCKYDDDGKYIEETGIKALFVDTGLEYPEIREFVKRFENVEWLRPKKTFKQVINEYGYPFISKEVSGMVAETRSWLDRHDLTFQNLVDRQTDRQTDCRTRTNEMCASNCRLSRNRQERRSEELGGIQSLEKGDYP